MRHQDLADVLRAALGEDMVIERPGWRSRGYEMGDVRGVLCHHTAGPASGNAPSLGVVENGRPGLPGPLAQFLLARDGKWYVIASGGANHAGLGGPAFGGAVGRDNGNAHLLGVEAENTGTGERWPDVQLRSYIRGVAAILKDAGLDASRALGHKEWAPTRKIDPAGIDMNWFRDEVAAEMEDDMPSAEDVANAVWAKRISLVTDRERSETAGDLLSGANVAAWNASQKASSMALGVPGAYHDGGGSEEEAEHSGARWVRQQFEALQTENEAMKLLLIKIAAKVGVNP